jgi:hypothetical protein
MVTITSPTEHKLRALHLEDVTLDQAREIGSIDYTISSWPAVKKFTMDIPHPSIDRAALKPSFVQLA